MRNFPDDKFFDEASFIRDDIDVTSKHGDHNFTGSRKLTKLVKREGPSSLVAARPLTLEGL